MDISPLSPSDFIVCFVKDLLIADPPSHIHLEFYVES